MPPPPTDGADAKQKQIVVKSYSFVADKVNGFICDLPPLIRHLRRVFGVGGALSCVSRRLYGVAIAEAKWELHSSPYPDTLLSPPAETLLSLSYILVTFIGICHYNIFL